MQHFIDGEVDERWGWWVFGSIWVKRWVGRWHVSNHTSHFLWLRTIFASPLFFYTFLHYETDLNGLPPCHTHKYPHEYHVHTARHQILSALLDLDRDIVDGHLDLRSRWQPDSLSGWLLWPCRFFRIWKASFLLSFLCLFSSGIVTLCYI